MRETKSHPQIMVQSQGVSQLSVLSLNAHYNGISMPIQLLYIRKQWVALMTFKINVQVPKLPTQPF